jgi:hypothetical protein
MKMHIEDKLLYLWCNYLIFDSSFLSCHHPCVRVVATLETIQGPLDGYVDGHRGAMEALGKSESRMKAGWRELRTACGVEATLAGRLNLGITRSDAMGA